jgi:hypothetical protein
LAGHLNEMRIAEFVPEPFFMASDKRIGHPSRDTQGATNRSPLA